MVVPILVGHIALMLSMLSFSWVVEVISIDEIMANGLNTIEVLILTAFFFP